MRVAGILSSVECKVDNIEVAGGSCDVDKIEVRFLQRNDVPI